MELTVPAVKSAVGLEGDKTEENVSGMRLLSLLFWTDPKTGRCATYI